MDEIVITGVPPYDGRWPFDLEAQELTTREWGFIKRLSGYLPLTVEDGFGDPELITVFAAIALRRAGKVEARQVPDVFERLADAPFGAAVTLETDRDEAEDDAGPPPSSSSSNGATSGPASTASSETSPPTPTASGIPASASSVSGPATSAT